MDFLMGGAAAVGAVVVSNPLDVIKTRIQLQGELRARGHYTKVYTNPVQALAEVLKTEGFRGLQRGFGPAAWYQVVMNGTRLSLFQKIQAAGLLNGRDGRLSSGRCVVAGAGVGCIAGFIASPLYMVKVQLQSQADPRLAVGHQHHHKGVRSALTQAFHTGGVRGLWRGAVTSLTRAGVGSAAQLFTYTKCKDALQNMGVCRADSWVGALAGAMLSGVAVTAAMSPFDVMSTRLYNQAVNSKGQGVLYKGLLDCFLQVVRTEGPLALYKGWAAVYLRIGPHSFINLMLWDTFKKMHASYVKEDGGQQDVTRR